MTFKNLMSCILDFFFVPKCAGCGERLPVNSDGCLCDKCFFAYEMETTKECAKCQKQLSYCSCSTENLEKAKIFRLVKLTVYTPRSNDYVINQMIFKLKKKSEYHLVEFLSREMADSIKKVINPNEDYIITYAPRSRKSILKYGYDHMEILSFRVAERLGLQFAHLLKRKSGVEQKTLSYAERMKNIELTFDNSDNVNIEGRPIILLDDVVTSGATLCAGARKLRKNGASAISCAVIGISRNTYIRFRIRKKSKY